MQKKMSKILRSYLSYVHGETSFSPWAVLYPFQFVTRAWMKLRIEMYNRGLFSVTDPVLPVISIGNNSFGGTNKTPMAELVVRQFLEAGIDAGLVSRGYNTQEHAPLWVGQDEKSLRREIAGDEPLMLARRLPNVKVVVSKDRIEGVRLLASLGAQVAVTDDTFQHRRMARDVDIVLVDSTCPFGNGNVLPAGSMREPMSAYKRADIVVLTKSNQATNEELEEIRKKLDPWVEPAKIFTAEIKLESWMLIRDGEVTVTENEAAPSGKYIAFSAIGNPNGFYKFIKDMGADIIAERSYRDHHIFSQEDINGLEVLAGTLGAAGFICTEKDVVNLPVKMRMSFPLYVPRIVVSLDDEAAFRMKIAAKLKPRFMIASNGHGEDAIGVVLAKKMRERFKSAEVSAFAFVGSGTHYEHEGIPVISPPSDMPSGGVIKYSFFDLLNDIGHGLGGSMRSQIKVLHSLSGLYRTPVCVGDVFLLVNVLWGQGLKPLLIATAKSVHLSGHMRVERWLLKKRSCLVWTRDIETAHELQAGGVNAVFCGNPVMDLIDENTSSPILWDGSGARIILLPGSRPRAYDDVRLILGAAEELSKRIRCSFIMVPAPTIDISRMAAELKGWSLSQDGGTLASASVSVKVYNGQVAEVARGADLLIGMGGTANQLCAGLGVPVVSILEKGKLRQKKLLKKAEILVKADPCQLASAAEHILTTPELREEMRDAGIRNLGGNGALDQVVEYCASELGWDNRCRVYEVYGEYLERRSIYCAHIEKELEQNG